MTPEEACLYLGISPDDEDLDIEQIERNYKTKTAIYNPKRFMPDTPEYTEAQRMRANIEEAYEYLTEAYYDLYGHDDPEPEEEQHQAVPHHNNNILLKLALTMTTITALCLAYFVYTSMNDKAASSDDRDYARVLQELEQLRAKTEIPAAANNIAPDYADLVERVMPSIVLIKTDTGTGSGFFVSSRGDILTNWHVIRDAGYITIITQDGKNINAGLKDYDAKRDMALLTVKTPYPVKFLKISPTLPRQGEAVIAIGNPKGLSGTVSNGIVSAFRENNTWVQFTAPISPGSSGGALINLRGEVVGMPTKLRTDGQNLNFAIAPGILSRFFTSARDKSPRSLPKVSNESVRRDNPESMIFVRKDESYEMYLAADYIEYDSVNSQAAFVTVWFPTEKTNRQMKKDPNFRARQGKDFGPCILLYAVDFEDNTYLHLRTVNLYTDGSIARDYVRPQREYRWEKPSGKSRINDLINALREYLKN